MNSLDYFKIKKQMVNFNGEHCGIACVDCPMASCNNGNNLTCGMFELAHPEAAEVIVQKWFDAQATRTRQSEFLKMFPNAEFTAGKEFLALCPRNIDKTWPTLGCDGFESCNECKAIFWLASVEEN